MKTPTRKFENLLKIFALLKEHDWTTAQALARELHTSERTIFRYIEEIGLAFSPMEVIESSKQGYRLLPSYFSSILENRDDMTLLVALGGSFSGKKTKGVPETLLRKIKEKIVISNNIPDKYIEPIFRSLIENKTLDITYVKPDVSEEKTIVPLKLVFQFNIPYLISLDLTNDFIKLLAVQKFGKLMYSKTPYPVEEAEKAMVFINSAWGIMVSGKIIEVKFRVDRDILPYFETSPLHSSQQLKKDKSGAVITLKIHRMTEFNRWAYRFGDHLEILDHKTII